MGPLPNGRASWLIDGGDPNYSLRWDDPQSLEVLRRISLLMLAVMILGGYKDTIPHIYKIIYIYIYPRSLT